MITTGSNSATLDFEWTGAGFEEVYPCRCGETHRGDYALYDYMHHECGHDEVWYDKSVDTDRVWCSICCISIVFKEVKQEDR